MAHTVFHQLLIALRALVKGIALVSLWIVVATVGAMIWFYFSSPVNLLVGGPLFLIGLTMGISALYEMVVGLISLRWGRTHCPFCEPSKEIEKILSPHDAFKE